MDSFTNQLLLTAPNDLLDQLGDGDSENHLTVFALPGSKSPAQALAHVVNGSMEGKWLKHGTVLQSLIPNVLLHVGKADEVCAVWK